MSLELRVRQGTTKVSDLQAFAQKVGDGAKIRGRKNGDGSITLYASTRKGTGLRNYLFDGHTASRRAAARDAIAMILNKPGDSLQKSLETRWELDAGSEMNGRHLKGLAYPALKEMVEEPAYAPQLKKFGDYLQKRNEPKDALDFLVGLRDLRLNKNLESARKAAGELVSKFLPTIPEHYDFLAPDPLYQHDLNIDGHVKKAAIQAVKDAQDISGLCEAFEEVERKVMGGGPNSGLAPNLRDFHLVQKKNLAK